MLTILGLKNNQFEYPSDVILTDEVKMFKDKVDNYIKIFTPSTDFKEDNYYKKNNLNDLPQEIRQLIAAEYIKNDLATYCLSASYIEYFGNKLADILFQNNLSGDYIQVQNDVEKSPHLYELVLFSNILATLRDNTNMLDLSTKANMNENKKEINEAIFKDKFLPAFEQAKLKNVRIANMDSAQRSKLYDIAKQYGNGELEPKPNKNAITDHDFVAIFGKVSKS